MQAKIVEYEGFYLPKHNGKVAYLVIGEDVFFTGITSSRQCTSTINAVESVIKAICDAEGFAWNTKNWYDYQTRTMYPGHEAGYITVNRLMISQSGSGINCQYLDRIPLESVPEEVHNEFEPYVK